MDQFISKETLDLLSYRSTLGQSLKQISLRSTPLETILDDIAKYRSSYIDVLVQGSKVKIPLSENMRRRSGQTVDLSSVSMMCWAFGFDLMIIRRNIQTIFVW
ncbi:MAG: hypothetical protein HFE94_06590 [Acutalibacter sp.]|nr:hypothetical protein [Acutalibacter sp.]